MLKFGALADLHYNPNSISVEMLVTIGNLKNWCNEQAADFAVDVGDKISETNHAEDLVKAARIAQAYDEFTCPVEHVLGNHDINTLTAAEWASITGKNCSTRSFDLNGHHLIFFTPNLSNGGIVPFTLTTAELAWLENDLAGTTLPTVIFSHVPLHRQTLKGNYWFESLHGNTTIGMADFTNSDAVMLLLRNSTTVAVFSGHQHWLQHHHEDGVHHVILPSSSDPFQTPPYMCHAITMVTIDDDSIRVHVKGRSWADLRLRKRVGNEVWNSQ